MIYRLASIYPLGTPDGKTSEKMTWAVQRDGELIIMPLAVFNEAANFGGRPIHCVSVYGGSLKYQWHLAVRYNGKIAREWLITNEDDVLKINGKDLALALEIVRYEQKLELQRSEDGTAWKSVRMWQGEPSEKVSV